MRIETSYSDEQLVSLAQSGSIRAYNLLLERYHHKIQQLIYFYINDRSNVNDLAQEVLLKVYRYLIYFKEESLFSTWLYKITQNTIKNYFRTIALRLDSEAHYIEEQTIPYTQSPEYSLMRMEFAQQIETAIARLSEELRICYALHTLEGYTYDDIAKKLDCPIGTVRSRIFRARKLLSSYIPHKT